jgi:hypothetical protein
MTEQVAGSAFALPAGSDGDARAIAAFMERTGRFRYYLCDVAGAVVGAYATDRRLQPGDVVVPCHQSDAPPWCVVNVLGRAATVMPARRPGAGRVRHAARLADRAVGSRAEIQEEP